MEVCIKRLCFPLATYNSLHEQARNLEQKQAVKDAIKMEIARCVASRKRYAHEKVRLLSSIMIAIPLLSAWCWK